jgi:DNA modification methylase
MVGMGSPFRNQLDWIALIKNNKTEFKNRIPVNQPNIINKYWYYGKHKYHPAEKDVEVSELLINWISDPHDTILDPFMGSGTTAVACAKLHRNFIGFELEQKYVDIANKRIEPWLQQTALTDYSTLEAAVC